MHKGIFVTGTDTGVGKTCIAAGLLRAFKERGMSVCPMKPVESGCRMRNGSLIPEDAVTLLNASGAGETIDTINPYRLNHPLAPGVAAEIEGIHIYKNKIGSAFRRLSKKYDLIIVEGAGGIMVPVFRKYLFLDLIHDLRLPVIIVSRPGLGTINHTLLTIDAARNRGLQVLGVIVNYTARTKRGLSETTNPDVIEKLGGIPVLGIVRYSKDPSNRQARIVYDHIAEHICRRV